MQNFSLIDGSGFLYRAYYGLPELTGPDGSNSNVVYGFAKMMLQLMMEQPDYMLIARDAPVKTKRHEQFEAYKANRPKAPDDFRQQIPKTKELIAQIGIPSFEFGGYEADDIIYTAANLAKENDLMTNIYSSDKDLKQLLCETVIFKDPMKHTITDVQKFETDFQFSPIYIVDYLSLVGDASDNIPGAAGIGPKWATTLILEYQTIENMYNNLEKIPEKFRTKLEASRENVLMSKKLIQLIQVPDMDSKLLQTRKNEPNIPLYEDLLLKQRNFKSLDRVIKSLKNKINQPIQTSLFG